MKAKKNGINFDNLVKMVDEKYISVQKHPTLDLFIYNYTQKAQFDRVWNEETLQCRGLIMDRGYNIISRPFPKFFNLSEFIEKGGQLPAEDFIVTEKMDGSLGVSYFDLDDNMHLATRGSFVSEQAQKGTKMLHEKYRDFDWNPAYTYLFEIIYPENRIVVDYAGMKDLILLSVIDTYTGEEFPYEKLLEWFDGILPVVKKYDGVVDYKTLQERPNAEGYVIAFPSTKQRFKVKFDEYVRLHRLVTGVNAKTIWELLRNNQGFTELLEKVPDEFYFWVRETRDRLHDDFNDIEYKARKDYEAIMQDIGLDVFASSEARKQFALRAIKHKNSSVLFAMLDDRDYKDIIWKQLKPKAEKPFREEI